MKKIRTRPSSHGRVAESSESLVFERWELGEYVVAVFLDRRARIARRFRLTREQLEFRIENLTESGFPSTVEKRALKLSSSIE